MAEFQYDNVQLVLGEPNTLIRQSLKSALYSRGFHDVIDTSHYGRVEEAVMANNCDLLIVDTNLPGGNVLEMIHKLRHHQIGNNPFLVIIALSSDPTLGMARQVLDSGADDLVLKPVSVEFLADRMDAFVRGRKPFVVTHDYIGPDRRKEPRPDGQQAAMLDVPNPLRQKVVGGYDTEAMQRLIDIAAVRINESKMERYSVQIGYLVGHLLNHYLSEPAESAVVPLIERMMFVAEDLGRRLRGTQFAHIAELALSLSGLAQRLRETPTAPDHIDLELLPKLAQAIERAFQIDQGEVAAAEEISQSVRSARKS